MIIEEITGLREEETMDVPDIPAGAIQEEEIVEEVQVLVQEISEAAEIIEDIKLQI